jgi:hypothetical protein
VPGQTALDADPRAGVVPASRIGNLSRGVIRYNHSNIVLSIVLFMHDARREKASKHSAWLTKQKNKA